MRFIIQRVTEACVTVENKTIGKIKNGYVVLIGISCNDTKEAADKLIKKMIGLRIFGDSDGKTNLSLADVDGGLLLISQFTLYANCKKGNRPSFIDAGTPEMAEELYKYIVARCREEIPVVEQGIFGAYMKVSLVNDGPFTVMLDSEYM